MKLPSARQIQYEIIKRWSPVKLTQWCKHDQYWYNALRYNNERWWIRRTNWINFEAACLSGNLNQVKWFYHLGHRWATKDLIRTYCVECNVVIMDYLVRKFKLTPNDFISAIIVNPDEGYYHDKFLRCVLKSGDLSKVRYLVECLGFTADMFRTDYALAYVVSWVSGIHLSIVRYLIKRVGLTVEDVREHGRYQVLLNAARLGYLSVIRFLVEDLMLTVPDTDMYNLRYLLYYTAHVKSVPIIRYLDKKLGIKIGDWPPRLLRATGRPLELSNLFA